MKKIIYLIGLTIIILYSCQKNKLEAISNQVTTLPTLIEMYNIINTDTDGSIVIQSQVGIDSQDGVRNNNISASSNESGNAKRNNLFTTITVGGIVLGSNGTARPTGSDQNKEVASLFGTDIPISINHYQAKGEGNTESNAHTLYMPKLISMTHDIDEISDGTKISWNADSKNKKGVIIRLEYTALTQQEESISNSNPNNITKGFVLPDNGTLTITNSMLKTFPNKANIIVTLARGNIALLDNKDETTYKAGGITSVMTQATVSK